ncbi:MAG: DHA2 family efflux MFS transporter permease subunit [Actinomycetes bacterium]
MSTPPDSTASAGVRRSLVLAASCLGVFMVLFDLTLTNIAVPHIMRGLGTGVSQAEWVVNAFELTLAMTLVVMGRIGDQHGRRKLFAVGLVVFMTGSLACALAPGIAWLIGFRFVQGLGAAMMVPQTLSIISATYPPEKRAGALGAWSAMYGLSAAAGPILSGVIVDAVSWRWIFVVNLPVAVVCALLVWRAVPESRDTKAADSLDLPGVGLLSAALFCITFAVIQGQQYGWTSATILGLFAAGAALLVCFLLVERRATAPLLDLGLLRDANFSAGNTAALLLAFVMLGVFFVMSLFLQVVLGYSAATTGAILSPLSVALMLAAVLAGKFCAGISPRWLIAGGFVVIAAGLAVVAGHTPFMDPLSAMTQPASLVVPFLVLGAGVGLAIAPLTTAVMATVPDEKAGQASGVLQTMRQLGAVLGVAVLGAVLQNRAHADVTAGVKSLSYLSPAQKASVLEQVRAGGTGSHAAMADHLSAAARLAEGIMHRMVEGWVAGAACTTLNVAIAVALVGAGAALFLQRPRPS